MWWSWIPPGCDGERGAPCVAYGSLCTWCGGASTTAGTGGFNKGGMNWWSLPGGCLLDDRLPPRCQKTRGIYETWGRHHRNTILKARFYFVEGWYNVRQTPCHKPCGPKFATDHTPKFRGLLVGFATFILVAINGKYISNNLGGCVYGASWCTCEWRWIKIHVELKMPSRFLNSRVFFLWQCSAFRKFTLTWTWLRSHRLRLCCFLLLYVLFMCVCVCSFVCLLRSEFCVSLLHIELNMVWGSQVSRVYFFCGFMCVPNWLGKYYMNIHGCSQSYSYIYIHTYILWLYIIYM